MKPNTVAYPLFFFLLMWIGLTLGLVGVNDSVMELDQRVRMLEAKQDQLELQAAGGWEPVDLTYLPRIRRNPELKQKEER